MCPDTEVCGTCWFFTHHSLAFGSCILHPREPSRADSAPACDAYIRWDSSRANPSNPRSPRLHPQQNPNERNRPGARVTPLLLDYT